MAKKLSTKAQQKLAALEEARRKVDRVHGMVEQYASQKLDHFAGLISRAATDIARVFMNNGYGVMADHAKSLGTTAKRGGATTTKFRALRETVAALRGELDRATKAALVPDAESPGAEG